MKKLNTLRLSHVTHLFRKNSLYYLVPLITFLLFPFKGYNQYNKIDYAGGFTYKQNKLDFFLFPEGRVTPKKKEKHQLEYQFKDHLGSIRISFKPKNGGKKLKVLQENHYYPFGMNLGGTQKIVGSSSENKFTYNGKEFEDENGLHWHHYGARYYDPQTVSWTSQDPEDEFYSPYSYVGGDPVNYSDPTGAFIEKSMNVVQNDDGTHSFHVIFTIEAKVLDEIGETDLSSEDAQATIKEAERKLTGSMGNVSWETHISLTKIQDENQLKAGDHIIRMRNINEELTIGVAAQNSAEMILQIFRSDILAHEIGHWLGLSHYHWEPANVMAYSPLTLISGIGTLNNRQVLSSFRNYGDNQVITINGQLLKKRMPDEYERVNKKWIKKPKKYYSKIERSFVNPRD